MHINLVEYIIIRYTYKYSLFRVYFLTIYFTSTTYLYTKYCYNLLCMDANCSHDFQLGCLLNRTFIYCAILDSLRHTATF